MKNITLSLLAGLGLLIAAPTSAHAKLNIFACEPEWDALAEEIGGDLVTVYTATKATQDVHHMRAKPSLLAAMRKADLVFCSGASLEVGWLPILIQKAGGPNVQPETSGWLMAADYVDKLEVMAHADRSMGHVHPEGNPHIHLNPHNIEQVAKVLADRLSLLDQTNAKIYAAHLDTFERKWQGLTKTWESQATGLRGKQVVVYHKSWAYLADWTGIKIAGTLEPKPGLPPTTAHLEKLLQSLKGEKVTAILVAPYEDEDAAEWLSSQTGIPILHLPYTVGGSSEAKTLEGLFNETIRKLKETAS